MGDPQSGPTCPTDDKLLKEIATYGPSDGAGRAAFETLYRRHCDMLGRACLRFMTGPNRAEDVRDLVDDTFIRAAEHADTYHANGATTAEQIARNTHRWLRKIAFHLYVDKRGAQESLQAALQTRHEDERVADLSCPNNHDGAPQPGSPCNGQIARATTALAKLSERDRNILVISLDWYNRETREFNVPPDIVENLCDLYGLTVSTYTQIRYRALKRVVQDFLGGTACVA